MPDKIILTAEEAKTVTPFFSWSEGYRAGIATALEAAKQRMVTDIVNARPAPKEATNGDSVQSAASTE